ncbi:hypothetical protein EJ06DRAFT_578808 [Trichodelitschia bisporula]|uniref:ferric-chelate reductase (NADPH) n=1 Tax=Trichodelitschia bisporula TaxID=703511 RepID=A0A6G1I7X1_9PEZI|nr:hypothetical protein EJ06DRAFT_578808 [Trichodelitschia bisporula]
MEALAGLSASPTSLPLPDLDPTTQTAMNHQLAGLENAAQGPLWHLPIDDPRCVNDSCLAFVYGYWRDQARYANYRFPLYAQWTVCFYAVVVVLFTALYARRRLDDQGRNVRLRERLVSYWRGFAYRRPAGSVGEWLDVSYGQLLLFTLASVFLLVLPFFQGYYLRDLFRFGSPPLSVRCAFIISALLPVMIALAGKVNVVTMLTGISYAKLNVWHRYVGYAVYALSVVHMVPHFISPVREGGLHELYLLLRDKKRELSGSVLQFIFTLLILTSIPALRSRMYEVFKAVHIALALAFFAFLTWHITGEYLTPDYLYATLAILALNFVARAVYRNRHITPPRSFLAGYPATLEPLPGNMTRVSIPPPASMTWSPGQHIFLTLPSHSRLQAHPFTIASLPSPSSASHELTLLIRARGGFTAHLAQLARAPTLDGLPSTRVWLDGPYGDYLPSLERAFRGVVCVAGGSGVTAVLPWVGHVARRMREGGCRARGVTLVWSVREVGWVRWVEREVGIMGGSAEVEREVGSRSSSISVGAGEKTEKDPVVGVHPAERGRVRLCIFVTSRSVSDAEIKSAAAGLARLAGGEDAGVRVEVSRGRPEYAALLPGLLEEGGRNVVLACGPPGQKVAVANEVARMQGLVREGRVKEVRLHTETFGW